MQLQFPRHVVSEEVGAGQFSALFSKNLPILMILFPFRTCESLSAFVSLLPATSLRSALSRSLNIQNNCLCALFTLRLYTHSTLAFINVINVVVRTRHLKSNLIRTKKIGAPDRRTGKADAFRARVLLFTMR